MKEILSGLNQSWLSITLYIKNNIIKTLPLLIIQKEFQSSYLWHTRHMIQVCLFFMSSNPRTENWVSLFLSSLSLLRIWVPVEMSRWSLYTDCMIEQAYLSHRDAHWLHTNFRKDLQMVVEGASSSFAAAVETRKPAAGWT